MHLPVMAWDARSYPDAMRPMEPLLRDKAIEVANALLAEGFDEMRAIRLAIEMVRAWAERRAGDPPTTH